MWRIRVLTVGNLYPPHHLGGYELVWRAAVQALRAAGHDARVLTTSTRLAGGEGAPEDPDVHRELRWYWRDHEFPKLTWRQRRALERHNHEVLGRHLEELRPDVVSWWHMGGMSMSLIERVRRAGLPALGWVNDDWLIYGPDVDQSIRPRRLDLGSAGRWIFCSDVTRRTALRVRPELADTAVLHQGAAPDFSPAPEREWEGRLLYAGRIDRRKGIGTLIDAVRSLDGATLRVLGDGDPDEAARLRERASERVSFEPAVARPELARAYAEADAVVFPVEWEEPWGLVPLEAMAVGRPVIATGRGGSGEYLEHERNALLFEAGDAGALADAVRRLAADAALRARLRAGGFETAAELTEERWTEAVVAEHERARDTSAPR